MIHRVTLNVLVSLLLCVWAAPADASTYTVLYEFGSTAADGAVPRAAPLMDSHGVLYGTTSSGGSAPGCKFTFGCGTVYSLTPPASPGGAWTEAILWSFGNAPDGNTPLAGLAIDRAGVLYGTTEFGGRDNLGTVFSLAPPSTPGANWTETVLRSFQDATNTIGFDPQAGLLIGSGGVLYGATRTRSCIFSLTPPKSHGGAWKAAVLHRFQGGIDGDSADNPLVMDRKGVLYGTTTGGGSEISGGTAFSLTPPKSPGGKWSYAVIYRFTGEKGHVGRGLDPESSLVVEDGMLYGATENGRPGGTVYELSPPTGPGRPWTGKALHIFETQGKAAEPLGQLALDRRSGTIYGTTYLGGTTNTKCNVSSCGIVYGLESTGTARTLRVLHQFDWSDGANPVSGVLLGKGGMLYGTTTGGGTNGVGTIFSLDPVRQQDGENTEPRP